MKQTDTVTFPLIIDRALWTAVKIRAAERGMKLKAYLTDLLARDAVRTGSTTAVPARRTRRRPKE